MSWEIDEQSWPFAYAEPPETITLENGRGERLTYVLDGWVGKPFVWYAEHVATKLCNEALGLMEGCDEPDFSALDRIRRLCGGIIEAASIWRAGKCQYESGFLPSETPATAMERCEKRNRARGRYGDGE